MSTPSPGPQTQGEAYKQLRVMVLHETLVQMRPWRKAVLFRQGALLRSGQLIRPTPIPSAERFSPLPSPQHARSKQQRHSEQSAGFSLVLTVPTQRFSVKPLLGAKVRSGTHTSRQPHASLPTCRKPKGLHNRTYKRRSQGPGPVQACSAPV